MKRLDQEHSPVKQRARSQAARSDQNYHYLPRDPGVYDRLVGSQNGHLMVCGHKMDT